MANMNSGECPRCGKPLKNFNGRIGFCSLHQWVSPYGLGFDHEANEKNEQEKARLEHQKLQEEAIKAQKEKESQEAEKARNIRKLIIILAAAVILIAGIAIIIVRPTIQYSEAQKLFEEQKYTEAVTAYSSLGNYKDAEAKKYLCEFLASLETGNHSEAEQKLQTMIADLEAKHPEQLKETLSPIIKEWKQNGLSALMLLTILDNKTIADSIEKEELLRMKAEAHAELLEETSLASYAEDVNGDGETDLVVLNSDYTIAVYRMASGANEVLYIEPGVASACATKFAAQFENSDLDKAVLCYQKAYELLPNSETRTALYKALQTRALSHESKGENEEAVSDAKEALQLAGTAEGFDFFYDLNLRLAKNGNSVEETIDAWNSFSATASQEISLYNAQDRWNKDAADLHILRARELASQKDDGCIKEIKAAYDLGENVSEIIKEAESYFSPGLTMANLRILEMELNGNDSSSKQSILNSMADEIRNAIKTWKTSGLPASEVPALIWIAGQYNIDLSGIDNEREYEEAAVASAGNVLQYMFVDWDQDNYKELLTINAEGTMNLYGTSNEWSIRSKIESQLPGCTFDILNDQVPLVLLISENNDGFLVATSDGKQLKTLFRENGISRYSRDQKKITYSKALEGSITRYEDYLYEATGIDSRLERAGVDWQENDYPYPDNAADTVIRYFEARTYDIPAESAVLTGDPSSNALFTGEAMAALPRPDDIGSIRANMYDAEDTRQLFEVTYTSSGQPVRTWVAAENNGKWKAVGASDTYAAGADPSKVDYTIGLISTNTETEGSLSNKGDRHTYRLLAVEPGRINLVWKSGKKAVSRNSHHVTMVKDSTTGETVFSYDLQPSPNKQQSKDQFIAPGVYYITVESAINDAEPYGIMIAYSPETNVEQESNDTVAGANAIELNTAYSGTLSSSSDTDIYIFALEEPCAVDVVFSTSGSGSKTNTFGLTVHSGKDGERLTSLSIPGNVQFSETGKLYLEAGKYLVRISKGSAYSSDKYTITVNTSSEEGMEAENNNAPESANTIQVNQEIHASFAQEGDVDYYTFTLEQDAAVQPRFSFKPTDSSSKTYVLTVMDSSRNELMKENIGGKESSKVLGTLALKAGTYLIKVENPRFVRQEYALYIACSNVDVAEKEPNNSAASAMELNPGTLYSGTLTNSEDVDYYKIVFNQTQTVTLSFTFAPVNTKSTAFVLTVEQNGKTQWTANITGDSGKLEQQLQFPAGEYYIRIKPSSWVGSVYSIIIN